MGQENQPKEKKPKFTPAPPDYSGEPPYIEPEEAGLPKARPEGMLNKLILPALAILVAVILVGVFFAPVNKKVYQADITRLESDLVAMRESNSSMTEQFGELNSKISAEYATKSSIDALANLPATVDAKYAELNTNLSATIDEKLATITELDGRITAMEATLQELGLINEEGKVIAVETTKWHFGTPTIDCPGSELLELDLDYDRIEEEGLYDIELVIKNISTLMPGDAGYDNDTVTLSNAELALVLQPREYVPINEDSTYLDSDDAPWLSWDADFVIKTREGVNVCRRITFTNDRANLGTLSPGETMQLALVLELYYK